MICEDCKAATPTLDVEINDVERKLCASCALARYARQANIGYAEDCLVTRIDPAQEKPPPTASAAELVDHVLYGDSLSNSLRITRSHVDANGLPHLYEIADERSEDPHARIMFQVGPRKDPSSMPGISEAALMAVLIDRYRAHQKGPFACRENALTLTKLEEALLWAQRRTRDRLNRDVLGENKR